MFFINSFLFQSKGGVLGKAVDYIHDLRAGSARMADVMKENERLLIDVELLRQQYEEATKENAMLRTQLQQHGLEPVSSATAQPHWCLLTYCILAQSTKYLCKD